MSLKLREEKMKYIFYLIVLMMILLHQPEKWKKLKDRLWEDNLGNIGLKTSRAVSDSLMEDRYITTIETDNKKLKDILDIKTFESVNNSSYYKDKNHVYNHYIMSDGGWFDILEEADSLTYKSIGGIYFKDKKHIYVERGGKIDVDYETFEVLEGVRAKDKNSYYMWGEKVTDEKM